MKPARPAATIDYSALAREVAPLVASLLAARLTGDQWPRTSRRADAPAGVPGRQWSKLAARIGRKLPGQRFHIVERADWDRYLAAEAPEPPAPRAWSPGDELPALKLRAVR